MKLIGLKMKLELHFHGWLDDDVQTAEFDPDNERCMATLRGSRLYDVQGHLNVFDAQVASGLKLIATTESLVTAPVISMGEHGVESYDVKVFALGKPSDQTTRVAHLLLTAGDQLVEVIPLVYLLSWPWHRDVEKVIVSCKSRQRFPLHVRLVTEAGAPLGPQCALFFAIRLSGIRDVL